MLKLNHCLISLYMIFLVTFGVMAQDPLYRIQIESPNPEALSDELNKQGFDVMHHVGPNSVDLVVTLQEWSDVEQMGHITRLLEQGRPFKELQMLDGPGLAPYPDLGEVEQALTDFAANFPQICQKVDLTQKYGVPATFEGRHIYAVKISDQVSQDEDEPNILVVSAHHSREIVTPVIALDMINRLTAGYGNDAEITAAINNYEIWISPVWNPDGYNEVFVGDNLWRKNRRVFPTGTGVDLNRNYPFGFDTGCSGSTNVNTQTYKGPNAASEPETQTMIAFSDERRFAKVLDFHSFGSEVLYDFACINIAFQSFWISQAAELSQASGYNGTIRRPSADGEHYQWQVAKMGNYGALTETHTTFQPSYASAESEAAKVWPGLLWLFNQPLGIWGRVTDATTGMPMELDIKSPDANFMNGESFGSGGLFGRYYHYVPPGDYTLIFEKDGYNTQTKMITLMPDSSVQLDIAMQPTCVGDFNKSQQIEIDDMVTIINQLGQSGVPQDINNDGTVDLADLRLILEAWLDCGVIP